MNEKDTDLETCTAYSISQNVNYPSSSLTSSTVVYHTISLMYKITHNLIANPISDFLIPPVRPSRHYYPLSYRLITATTDNYNVSFFPRAVFHWSIMTFCLKLWPVPPWSSTIKQSARMKTSHHRKSPYFLT